MYLSGKADEYPTSMPALTNYPVATIGSNADDTGKYIMTTKIMVVALAVLFAVVFFVICFHIYAKWVWSTSPGHTPASLSFWPLRWRRTRASQVILDADVLDLNLVVGLGKAAVEALPTFKFKESTEIGPLECAICLGQFQEDELGRELPNCNHRFHLECIDMWLYSHSTCPLCRDILEPRDEEDEEASISLNLESASIQVFRTERLSAARRLQPGEQPAPRRLQPEEHEEHSLVPESEHGGEQDTANKRADAIPANVLFWGNLMQQQGAHSRFLNNSRPAHIAIAVDFDMGTSPPAMEQQSSLQNHDTFSHSNNSL